MVEDKHCGPGQAVHERSIATFAARERALGGAPLGDVPAAVEVLDVDRVARRFDDLLEQPAAASRALGQAADDPGEKQQCKRRQDYSEKVLMRTACRQCRSEHHPRAGRRGKQSRAHAELRGEQHDRHDEDRPEVGERDERRAGARKQEQRKAQHPSAALAIRPEHVRQAGRFETAIDNHAPALVHVVHTQVPIG